MEDRQESAGGSLLLGVDGVLGVVQGGESALQTLSSRAGIALKKAGTGRAGDDLAWAWGHLGAGAMGRTIVQRLAAGQMDQLAVFGQPWEILELAAMSLGFDDVMTALDLCADAMVLIGGEPAVKLKDPRGTFYDLGELRKRVGKLCVPPAIRAWVDQLLAHPDLEALKVCRDALTHRQVRLHPGVRWENGRMTRALAEITPLDSRGVVRSMGSIGDLVPRLVGFGELQLAALCRAILDTWGG